MSFLIFAGIVSFITGIMLILFPNALTNITTWANRLAADVDKRALKYRIGLGLSFLLTGMCLWFVAYYMWVMPQLEAIL